MDKRPPRVKRATVLIYSFIVVFSLLMITGASFAAIAVFVLLGRGFAAALPYFLIGLTLIVFGYLINVYINYLLTKAWDWHFFRKR